MSVIRPFTAMLPDAAWFRSLLNSETHDMIKGLLEPRGEHHAENRKLQKHREAMEAMLDNKNYNVARKPAIYIYERETSTGSQVGVWVQTCLADMDEVIVPNEHTLAEQQQRHLNYREQVGLEESPVLLTYHLDLEVERLTSQLISRLPDEEYYYRNQKHKLWMISDKRQIIEFREAFSRISRVYVADGHHRLAATAQLDCEEAQWITSMYVNTNQLQCREFNKIVLPERGWSKEALLKALEIHFYISPIPGNVPYLPYKPGRMGLLYMGKWYQLDMKEHSGERNSIPDVTLLQAKVLEPIFGISDPRTDKRLVNRPVSEWDEMMEMMLAEPQALLFTLCPISAEKLVHFSNVGLELPPKSTYTEPKVPYGMLLCCNKSQELCGN